MPAIDTMGTDDLKRGTAGPMPPLQSSVASVTSVVKRAVTTDATPRARVRSLPRRHAVYRLAPDLLLVFKPRGHTEAAHAHPYRQRLRILRGRLQVRTARRTVVLTASSHAFLQPAGRAHRTAAVTDTWVLVESLPPGSRRSRS